MDSLIGWLGLILGFSGIVFVHELGHYILAKWHGVRVRVFSIGFGPYLFSFTRGETVYALSLVPVGGYVMMSGQDDLRPDLPASSDPRDYRNKPCGQRAAILAAGAIFNLIFALGLFTLCYHWGVRFPPPIVGDQLKSSPLANAEEVRGPVCEPQPLRYGDRILSINGTPVKSTLEAMLAIATAGPKKDVWIQYERDGRPAQYPVLVRTKPSSGLGAAGLDLGDYAQETPFQLGFETERGVFVMGVVEGAPAQRAGLQRGDRIVSLNGQPLEKLIQLFNAVAEAQDRPTDLVVEREGKELRLRLTAELKEDKSGGEPRYQIGILPAGRRVKAIDERCEAYALGLRPGCFIHAAARLRDQQRVGLAFRDLTGKDQIVRLPVPTACGSQLQALLPLVVTEEHKAASWWDALGEGWHDLTRHAIYVFVVVKGLIQRDISMGMVSGPLGIGHAVKTVAEEKDLTYFLWFLGFISVNIGMLQFVPVPLLDGWHIVLVLYEKLRGKAVSVVFQRRAQIVGLVLLGALLLWATKNDVFRYLLPR